MDWIIGMVAGLAVLVGFKAPLEDMVWLPLGWLGWAVGSRGWGWVVAGVATLAWGLTRSRRSSSILREHRSRLTEFWASVALYLNAGLGFWPALEEAAGATPGLAGSIRRLGRVIAEQPDPQAEMEHFCRTFPGPESEIIATMMEQGYRHGITAGEVVAQAQEMQAQLTFEKELRRRRDPIWLAIIPGVLLVNMLLILAVPMAIVMVREWNGVW